MADSRKRASECSRLPPPAPPMPPLPCDCELPSVDLAETEYCVLDPLRVEQQVSVNAAEEICLQERSRSRSPQCFSPLLVADACVDDLSLRHGMTRHVRDRQHGQRALNNSGGLVHASSNEETGESDALSSQERANTQVGHVRPECQANNARNKNAIGLLQKDDHKKRRTAKQKKLVKKHKSKTKTRKYKKKLKKKKKKEAQAKKAKRKQLSSSSYFSSASTDVEDPPSCFARAMARKSQGEIILAKRILRRNGFSWKDASGNSPLHLATQNNCIEIVTWILGIPEASPLLDAQNLRGETALLVASRLFRGTIALRLIEALADPNIANRDGDCPEAFDLNGLLQETESNESIERLKQQKSILASIATARKSREEAEWRDRLLFETGMDEDQPFAAYADLEYQDVASGGRDWTDEIAAEVAARQRKDRTERLEEYAKMVEEAKEKAKSEAEAQEAEARAFARETRAKASEYTPEPRFSSEKASEKRVRLRAADEARWNAFEQTIQNMSVEASASASTCDPENLAKIRADIIPWPSGPPENPLLIDPEGHPAMIRSQLRAGLLRWHPDKFAQRIGRYLLEEEAENESALARVKAIAQQLNRLMSTLITDGETT